MANLLSAFIHCGSGGLVDRFGGGNPADASIPSNSICEWLSFNIHGPALASGLCPD